MGVHLYCIGPIGHEPATGLGGMERRPVVPVDVPPFTAWISEHGERPTATVENLREHHRVVWASITRDVTPLPVRFGQWFRSRSAMSDGVSEHRDRYAEWLTRFRGKLEFGLRLIDPAGIPAFRNAGNGNELGTGSGSALGTEARTGTEYLRALVRRHAEREETRQRAERLASEVEKELKGTIARQRSDPLTDGGGIVALAHLVDRGQVPEYRRARAALRRTFGSLRLIATGPWPPYSFVR